MNSLQKLCVVCSKCNECAMEMECLKYCDPSTVLVESTPFKRNGLMVIYLYRTVYPALTAQNNQRTSTLTLYMEMLLRCLYEDVLTIDAALDRFMEHRDRNTYFETVLKLNRCDRHETVEVTFTDRVVLRVQLSTLNDVERFLCKMNYVYGIINPNHGLAMCRQVLSLLGRLCGISPVASPETYTETATCFQCYQELSTVPNQGRSISKRLQGRLCDHVTICKSLVQLDTDIQTMEQDILHLGAIPGAAGALSAIKNLSCLSPVSHSYINEAEEALREYNPFTDIPDRIYSLSDFTYWSKTSEIMVKRVGVTAQHLNLHHQLCLSLKSKIGRFLYGDDVEDLFSVGEETLAEDERLFAGSIFAAPNRMVDLITSMSITAFEENPMFSRIRGSDETYVKIKSLIEEIRSSRSRDDRADGDGAADGEAGGAAADEAATPWRGALESGDPLLRNHDPFREVNVRKKAYMRKVSEAGYNKVMGCIKKQENLITKLVNVNLVGTTCFEALSKIMNGLLLRRSYVEDEAAVDIGDRLTYDDHLYVVNNLVHKRLPLESLPSLAQQIYRFANGPLFDYCEEYYTMPYNIGMAYACDNAGVLPHVKDDIVRCAEGTMHPSEWMVVKYKGFFDFSDALDVNTIQNTMWTHVRELVLSIALYNEVFGKSVILRRADEASGTQDDEEVIVLTYNREWPLFLKKGCRKYKSKDLYLLLHCCTVEEVAVSRDAGAARYREEPVRPGGRKRRSESPLSLLDLVRGGVDDDDALVPRCLLSGGGGDDADADADAVDGAREYGNVDDGQRNGYSPWERDRL